MEPKVLFDVYTCEYHHQCEICGVLLAPQMLRVRYANLISPVTGQEVWRVAGYRCMHHPLEEAKNELSGSSDR